MRQSFVRGVDGSLATGILACCAAMVCLPGSFLGPVAAVGQAASSPTVSTPATGVSASSTAGGTLHGAIKSGNIPLPGVAVTATNTLTGKRFATTTDITGAWSMTIPQNGRYVIKTEFAAFAAVTHEALLNANSHDQAVNFDLALASRAAQQDAREQGQSSAGQAARISQAMQQLGVNGAQSLSLLNSLAAGTDAAEEIGRASCRERVC